MLRIWDVAQRGVLSQPAQHPGFIVSIGKIMSQCHKHSIGFFLGGGLRGLEEGEQVFQELSSSGPLVFQGQQELQVDRRKDTKRRKSIFPFSMPSPFSPHHASLSSFCCPLSCWAIPCYDGPHFFHACTHPSPPWPHTGWSAAGSTTRMAGMAAVATPPKVAIVTRCKKGLSISGLIHFFPVFSASDDSKANHESASAV